MVEHISVVVVVRGGGHYGVEMGGVVRAVTEVGVLVEEAVTDLVAVVVEDITEVVAVVV
jgi:hypothetical protein